MSVVHPPCRFCRSPLSQTVIDLGTMPLANSLLTKAQLDSGRERAYPLKVRLCHSCHLVQVDDYHVDPADIFSDYLYFSSYSKGWVAHAKAYAEAMIASLRLGANSLVVEIASNDGYLLKHFKAAGVPVLGVDPAANVAKVAEAAGITTRVALFGESYGKQLAAEGIRADLMAANNVLAHVPDIGGFVRGFTPVLKPQGVLTFEFPHLLNLLAQGQFDTIYHEHFSYLSLLALEGILASAALRVFDVDEIATHGGSLRLYVCHQASDQAERASVQKLRDKEKAAKLDQPQGYAGLAPFAQKIRSQLLAFLSKARAEGKSVAAYGAAAKGNTMLNYCGIGTDLLAFVADRSREKQNLYLPGSHLAVKAPDAIFQARPDYVLILPWNLKEEISRDLAAIRGWGGQFVIAVPQIEVF